MSKYTNPAFEVGEVVEVSAYRGVPPEKHWDKATVLNVCTRWSTGGQPDQNFYTLKWNEVEICDVRQSEIRKTPPLPRTPIDEVYRERNRLVAALAKIYPSGVALTDIPDWDPCWHHCVYIDLPTGQASWHFHDRDTDLFINLPPYDGEWDGHTTKEKYSRLAALKYDVELI